VAATTKCHGWELTDDGLQRSSARTCSKTESDAAAGVEGLGGAAGRGDLGDVHGRLRVHLK
jgi:hypothetical protein